MIRGRRNPLHFGLAARLKKMRKATGLSAHALSLAAGLSHNTVAFIEEEGRIPGLDVVEKLAKVLGTGPCRLAYGMEDAAPPLQEGPLRCEQIGQRLASTRQARGGSVRALAQEAKLSHTALGNIEAARVIPSVATAEGLAKALRVSPCWLSYGEGEMELPPKPRRRKAPSSLTP